MHYLTSMKSSKKISSVISEHKLVHKCEIHEKHGYSYNSFKSSLTGIHLFHINDIVDETT